MGFAALALGAAFIYIGAQPMEVCTNAGCKEGIPDFGYLMMAVGTIAAVEGIYLLVREGK